MKRTLVFQKDLGSLFFCVVTSVLEAEESFWAKRLHQRSDPADQHERKE
jgi:hypothetical protein